MSVNVETLDKLERKLVLNVPAESIQFEINKRLQKLARSVKMDGFRPGKVPMNVVTKQYHGSVQQEVVNDKVGRAFHIGKFKDQAIGFQLECDDGSFRQTTADIQQLARRNRGFARLGTGLEHDPPDHLNLEVGARHR